MAFRIIKGDTTIEADTEDELKQAIRVLAGTVSTVENLLGDPFVAAAIPADKLRALAPSTEFIPYTPGAPFPHSAMYGTNDYPMGTGELGEYYEPPEEGGQQSLMSDQPKLTVVENGGIVGTVTHIDRSSKAFSVAITEQISVRREHLKVLNAVISFTDGVTAQGVCQILGVGYTFVGPKLSKLQKMALVERIPHSLLWRATDKARRAKLVAS